MTDNHNDPCNDFNDNTNTNNREDIINIKFELGMRRIRLYLCCLY